MKYTIQVTGKGAEAFIHRLTPEQHEKLNELGVEDDSLDGDQISDIIDHDYLESEDIVTGIYNGDNNINIKVTDEQNNIVWESYEEFEFEDYEYEYKFNDGEYLSCEDYQKGNFFNFILDTKEDFNPNLLKAIVVELLDGRSELIVDLKYNGREMTKEYGDTISKGFTFMLS